jgi:hypothetical protein
MGVERSWWRRRWWRCWRKRLIRVLCNGLPRVVPGERRRARRAGTAQQPVPSRCIDRGRASAATTPATAAGSASSSSCSSTIRSASSSPRTSTPSASSDRQPRPGCATTAPGRRPQGAARAYLGRRGPARTEEETVVAEI